MNTRQTPSSMPVSLQASPRFETFDCWPELSLAIVLCALAYATSDCVALVAWGGVAIVALFAARTFLSPRSNLLGLRSLAVLSYGAWMFFGMLRYVLGQNYTPFFPLYWTAVDKTARLTALGFAVLLLGLALPRFRRVPGALVVRRKLSPAQLHVIAAVFILASSAYLAQHNNFFGYSAAAPFYIGLVAPLVIPGLILLGYLVAAERAYVRQHLMSVGAVSALGLAVALLDPSRRAILTALLGVLGIVALKRGSLMSSLGPLKRFFALAATVVVFAGLYFLGNALRAVSFSGNTVSGFSQAFTSLNRSGSSTQPFYELEFVMEEYPHPNRFLQGSSVVNLLFNFVPRSVWPGKPVAFSKELAMRMMGVPDSVPYSRQLDREIRYQSYSGTLVGEGYANFGVPGVVAFLFLFGVAVCFIEKYLERNSGNQFAVLVYACSIAPILFQQRGDLLTANFFSIQAIGSIFLAMLILGRTVPGLSARRSAMCAVCPASRGSAGNRGAGLMPAAVHGNHSA